MSFKNFSLNPQILKSIEEAGFSTPTLIQQQAIPAILEGRDLLASAPTGTGKTAAFILPVLHQVLQEAKTPGKSARVLILVPTRELAMQVAAEATKYSRHLSRVKTVCIYGGVPYPIQKKDLSRPFEILVATPGRLIDHMEQGRIQLNRIETFILDEADRMLDMGFIEDVEHISSLLPKEAQTLLFSATLKGSVRTLAKQLLENPVEISVDSPQGKHENITQHIHYVDNKNHKHRLLDHFLKDDSLQQAIIFTSTKLFADELADKLKEEGHSAAKLHGDMNQRQRTKTISQLRQGKIRILVATDVAARGIDVQSISHVINFDLPPTVDDYIHRIGRTGRADSKGVALTFVSPRDLHLLRRIEDSTGQKMNALAIPGLESTFSSNPPSAKPKERRHSNFKPKRQFGNRRNNEKGPGKNRF